MTESRILITGASGCVGQYTANWFFKNTKSYLYLWVRDPRKLTGIDISDSRIKLLKGDLREPEKYKQELNEVTHVIHTATAWGDPERAYQVNLLAVKEMLALLNPLNIKKIIYFSTASILDSSLQPLPEAFEYGTEYIQTKATCLEQLENNQHARKIIAVFPTLVFGGKCDGTGSFPRSYLTEGLREATKWLWLARWLKAYSKFHFIHAADIAFICGQLCTNDVQAIVDCNSEEIPKLVMGQDALSIDKAIETLLKWRGVKKTPRLPLWNWLIKALIQILPIQLSPWDRFSIKQRHFVYSPVINPETFGGISYAKNLSEVLFSAGLPRRNKKNT